MDQRTKELLHSGRVISLDGFTLGDVIIDDDGELRGYICGFCGKQLTEAYHMKPENYRFKYRGIVFYLEVHICPSCKKKLFPKVRTHLHAKDPTAPSP